MAVVNYFDTMGIPSGLDNAAVGQVTIIGTTDDKNEIDFACSAIKRILVNDGATTISRINDDFQKRRRRDLSDAVIGLVFGPYGVVSQCKSHKSWYFAKDESPTQFERRLLRVLSIVKDLPINELYTALRRDYRHGRSMPPRNVFAELLPHINSLRVENDRVSSRATLDSEELIGRNSERIIIDLLIESKGVLSRRELQRQALARSVGEPRVWQLLNYSPFIVRLAAGVYGLVGIQPPVGLVEELSKREPSIGGVKDRGWTKDGRCWIAYRLSLAACETGVLGIPSAVRDMLQGDFELLDPEMEPAGNIRIQESSAWGLRSLLGALNAQPGDVLLLLCDLKKRQIVTELGDDALIDQYA